jgi:hypothetical protein
MKNKNLTLAIGPKSGQKRSKIQGEAREKNSGRALSGRGTLMLGYRIQATITSGVALGLGAEANVSTNRYP